MSDDERLLRRLEAALGAESEREPTIEEVALVRARAELGARSTNGRHRRARRARVLVAAVLVMGLVFGAGVLLSDELPRSVRAAAHDLGLPIASPELVDAQSALHELGVALANKDVEEVRSSDARMVELVGSLSEEEAAEVEPVAHEVHLRAEQFLEQRGG